MYIVPQLEESVTDSAVLDFNSKAGVHQLNNLLCTFYLMPFVFLQLSLEISFSRLIYYFAVTIMMYTKCTKAEMTI